MDILSLGLYDVKVAFNHRFRVRVPSVLIFTPSNLLEASTQRTTGPQSISHKLVSIQSMTAASPAAQLPTKVTMRSFTISFTIALALTMDSRNCVEASTSQFKEWYPQYGSIFATALRDNCSAQYERYLTGTIDQVPSTGTAVAAHALPSRSPSCSAPWTTHPNTSSPSWPAPRSASA